MDKKRALSLGLRIAISVGLLVFLFAQIPEFEFEELVPEWKSSTPWWLAGALGLMIGSMIVSVVRWYEVGHGIGVTVPIRRYFSHYMAGQFVSNFVPTTVGGDVLRVTRLSKDSNDSPHSFASVVFERLSGWLVLPAISFVGFIANPGLRDLGVSTRVAMLTGAATLVGLVLVLLVAGNDATGRLLERREGIFRWINAIHVGLDELRKQPRALWRILAAGFAYQLVLLSAVFCAARAIGIEQVGLTALLAFLPAVLIVQVLPLGIGGLGVREGAFVLFFGSLGVPDEQSIALGFLVYLLTVVSSLIGFPSLILGGRNGSDEAEAVEVDEADAVRHRPRAGSSGVATGSPSPEAG